MPVKKGIILPWWINTDEIPEGYILCDGNNDTPDLRNIVCAGLTPQSPQQTIPNHIMKT